MLLLLCVKETVGLPDKPLAENDAEGVTLVEKDPEPVFVTVLQLLLVKDPVAHMVCVPAVPELRVGHAEELPFEPLLVSEDLGLALALRQPTAVPLTEIAGLLENAAVALIKTDPVEVELPISAPLPVAHTV